MRAKRQSKDKICRDKLIRTVLPVKEAHVGISETVIKQREYFSSQATKPYSFRRKQLKELRAAIIKNESKIAAALQQDLNRSDAQAYMTETGMIIQELTYIIRRLKGWMKRKKLPSPFILPFTKFYVSPEPYGVVLIISPWNYPFFLTFLPLMAALAAGNCAVVKPSKASGASMRVIDEILTECFPEEYADVITPDSGNAYDVLNEKFDYIFFTGGTETGRKVLHSAAENITPVTLELGGKCPCIVHEDCDFKKTVARITAGKFLNAGQTCVAPDYILAHKGMRLIIGDAIRAKTAAMYGEDAYLSKDFGRIINERELDRIAQAAGQDIKVFKDKKYIEPLVVENAGENTGLMQEEVFGPVLPIVYYDTIEEAIEFVNKREKPLVLYLFTKSRQIMKKVLAETSSGSACVNDTVVHMSNPDMPFGGTGGSGFGRYRGKAGFDTFSNMKSVMEQTNLFDMKLRYPPVTNAVKTLLKMILR